MSKDAFSKRLKVGDKVRCVSLRSKFGGCQGEVVRIVVDKPHYEQEVAVAWMSQDNIFLGQSNRMLVSGLELLSAMKDNDPYAELKKAYAEGKTIQVRQPSGVWVDLSSHPKWVWDADCYRIKPEEPRLVPDGGVRVGELHVIIGRPGAGASHFMSTEVAKQKSTNQQKENTMKLELTTRHFLNGRDVAELSIAQIYDVIAKAEIDIRDLEKIENKPKRLVKEIEKRKADLKALVDFLDAQDAS